MAKSSSRIAAQALRASGVSIGSIAMRLGVAKSSVSLWCRGIVLSPQQARILNARAQQGANLGRLRGAVTNHAKRVQRLREAYHDARGIVGALSDRDLWMLGIALYWAEGNKKGQTTFGFANSDPHLIVLLMRWLRRCLGVRKCNCMFRVMINQIHRHRAQHVLTYWSRIVGVSPATFHRTTFTKNVVQKRYANHDHHFGTLHVRIRNGSPLLFRVLGCIAVCAGVGEDGYLNEISARRTPFVGRKIV